MKSTGERWLLQGHAPRRYERYKVPRIFRPLAERFVDHVGNRPGERLLDVACGTGIVARVAAPLVRAHGKVAAIDVNCEMLAVAAGCARVEGAVIEWLQADATELPFGSGAFDTVLCQQGLQFFPDRARALGEMRRVLAPDGRIALNVWGPRNPYLHALARALRRHFGAEAAERSRAPLALADRAALLALLQAAGLRSIALHAVTILREVGDLRQGLLQEIADFPFAAQVCQADTPTLAAMAQSMIAELRPYRTQAGYLVPVDAYFVTACVA
jgi:SAM-dependent methyltransferase